MQRRPRRATATGVLSFRAILFGRAITGLGVTLLVAACGLAERADVLLGRACQPDKGSCDPGQVCLPHALEAGVFSDYFCRDEASFLDDAAFVAPLAYCDPDRGLRCPGRLGCRADRIRTEVGPRPLVCKAPTDPFGPPDEDSAG